MLLGGEDGFRLVEEDHLHHLVAELEHDGVLVPRPLLHVRCLAGPVRRLRAELRGRQAGLTKRSSILLFQDIRQHVVLEVPQECHLLLQVLRIVLKGVGRLHLRPLGRPARDVVEVPAVWHQHDLGRVVEVDADRAVRHHVANTILAGVVDPPRDPQLRQRHLRGARHAARRPEAADRRARPAAPWHRTARAAAAGVAAARAGEPRAAAGAAAPGRGHAAEAAETADVRALGAALLVIRQCRRR
mmetsp:Transcript_110175/g.351124  ORF Transcript_110175/g.351124 Transcript_110175/m.351124 type:complete len:244 (-) Transcript_110175:675-1406(-)